LITCFIDDYSLPFNIDLLPETVKESIFIEKSKAIFDLATLPKLNLTCPDTVNFNTITAQEILELLPNNSNLDFQYRHRVCRFCHTNGLELNMFLAWICGRFGDKLTTELQTQKQKQWETHWRNIEKFPPMSIDGIKPILK